MPWYLSLLTTLLVFGVGSLAFQFTGSKTVIVLIVLLSAIWAAIDSSRLKMYRYQVSLSSSVSVFIGMILWWVIVFPLYLINRGRVVSGAAPLKERYQSSDEIE